VEHGSSSIAAWSLMIVSTPHLSRRSCQTVYKVYFQYMSVNMIGEMFVSSRYKRLKKGLKEDVFLLEGSNYGKNGELLFQGNYL